jgi:hypothetical protein
LIFSRSTQDFQSTATLKTWSLVALDRGSLYRGQMNGETQESLELGLQGMLHCHIICKVYVIHVHHLIDQNITNDYSQTCLSDPLHITTSCVIRPNLFLPCVSPFILLGTSTSYNNFQNHIIYL